MMESKLSIQDRLAVLSILPAQGDATTLKIVRQLREELSFTEKEHEDYGLVSENGRVLWDASINGQTKTIDIGRKAREMIVAALQERDRGKQLEDGHLDIWDLFVDTDSD